MNALHRAIRLAQQRWFWQSWLRWTGWAALIGLGLAAALLVADRGLSLPIPGWVFLALVGLAIVVPAVWAWWTLPSASQAAMRVDHRLGLKDRLASGLFAASLAQDDPLAQQVMRDADRAAADIRLSQAVPVRFTRVWGWVVPAAGVVALLALFMPADLNLLRRGHNSSQEQTHEAQAQAARAQIVQARSLIRELDTQTPELSEADPAAVLKELAQLTQRDLSDPQAQRQAAAELSQVQDKLAQAKQEKEQAFRTLQNAMSQLDTAQQGPANRFADALRRGDFDAAQRELESLARKVEQSELSESDKELLRQQLQQMSQQLEQLAQQAAQQQAQSQQQIQQSLQQAGLSQQQIQQLQQQGYPPQAVQQAVQQSLQQQGVNPQQAQQQAQRIAQQVQQQQQQSQNAGQCQSCASGLANSLGQMSQSLGQQGQNGSQQQQNGSSFSQNAWQAQQQLSQIAQMQQQLQRMGMAQSQLQNAMQNLTSSSPQQSPQPGTGGREAGTAVSGNPLGQQRQLNTPYQTRVEGDIGRQDQGRVIASWLEHGPTTAGEPTVEFNHAVTQAQDQAERAVTEDRVPRRYHGSIRDYFGQLPQAAQAAQQAPPAPR